MHAFNQSLKYDQRMHAADIKGSIAYTKSLTIVGILTKAEEKQIIDGLELVGKEWGEGVVKFIFRISFPTFTDQNLLLSVRGTGR
jgi:argininosuccinate lyase